MVILTIESLRYNLKIIKHAFLRENVSIHNEFDSSSTQTRIGKLKVKSMWSATIFLDFLKHFDTKQKPEWSQKFLSKMVKV
jgi:hypothetical protein